MCKTKPGVLYKLRISTTGLFKSIKYIILKKIMFENVCMIGIITSVRVGFQYIIN